VGGSIYWISRKKNAAPDQPSGESTAALRDIAAELPDDVPLVVAVQNLERPPLPLDEINTALNSLPDLKRHIDEENAKRGSLCRELLGFDADNKEAWSKAGFDLTKPSTAFLMPFDAHHLDLAEKLVFAISPSNSSSAEKTIRRVWEESTDAQINELLGSLEGKYTLPQKRALAAVKCGARLFFKQKTSSESEQQMQNLLSSATSRPLSGSAEFIACLSELPKHTDVAAYINLTKILSSLPKDHFLQFASSVQALSFSSSYEEQSLFVLLSHDINLNIFRSGSECRDFMARFDAPLGALSWSLADPSELGRALRRAWPGSDSAKSESNAFDSGEYDQLLKNNCGGALVFPDEGKLLGLSYAVFIKVNDMDAFEAVRARHRESSKDNSGETRKQCGNNVLYISSTGDTVRARIGEFWVAGTALKEIEALASGKAKGWKPVIGGKALLEVQVPIAAAVLYAARKQSAEVQNVIRADLPDSLHFRAMAEQRGNGLFYHGEFHGLYSALVKLAADLAPYVSKDKSAKP
jgi:hypothetical protein